MEVIQKFVLTTVAARRSATWRRGAGPLRGWVIAAPGPTTAPAMTPVVETKARRRLAMCELMDAAGVPNTAQAHRRSYARLWTDLLRDRVGDPPRPEALVRWRRRFVAQRQAECAVTQESSSL